MMIMIIMMRMIMMNVVFDYDSMVDDDDPMKRIDAALYVPSFIKSSCQKISHWAIWHSDV